MNPVDRWHRIRAGNGDRYNGMVIPGTGWPDSAKGRFPEATARSLRLPVPRRQLSRLLLEIQWGQLQPRVGIAYQFNDKTVVRAGGGRFFTRLGVSDSVFLGGNPPFQPTANVTFGNADNPGGTSANTSSADRHHAEPDFKNPEAWNWNFTVERRVLLQLRSERRLMSVAADCTSSAKPISTSRRSQLFRPPAVNPNVNLDALRPYQGYNSIRETDNVASSRYNSLQVAWNSRFSNGLLFGVAYTLLEEHG